MMASPSAIPPGLRAFEPTLGAFGMAEVLDRAGVVTISGEPLAGLPAPAGPGRPDCGQRVGVALLDLVARFPVGHLVLVPDLVLLGARQAVLPEFPTSLWLPHGTEPSVVEHFTRTLPGDIDLAVAPQLPQQRGPLPALVVLGCLASSLAYVPPSSLELLDLFSGHVLGMTVALDPTDAPGRAPVGWASRWTSNFTAAYRPADQEDNPPEPTTDAEAIS